MTNCDPQSTMPATRLNMERGVKTLSRTDMISTLEDGLGTDPYVVEIAKLYAAAKQVLEALKAGTIIEHVLPDGRFIVKGVEGPLK